MRHITILIISFLSLQLSYSQINEIGVYAGGSNLVTDVGSTRYINPDSPALGLIYKLNASSRHSWRLSVIYADIQAHDSKSTDPRRIQRDYDFDSNLLEISGGLEFTFLDFNLHSGLPMITPYLYSGLSAIHFDDYYFSGGTQTPVNTKSWSFAVPMTVGIKTNILGKFVIGAEVGARYTFTDALDGSYPNDPNLKSYRFGNINNNDWYVFSGFTLTYTFGENPCYCAQ